MVRVWAMRTSPLLGPEAAAGRHSPGRAELREPTQALLQRLRAQQEAAMLCLSRWGCGAARSCVGGAGLSPLDAHVAVEPELHEAGLQVGVRHVQQHLYDARERSLSERRRCGFPGRQSVPWIRPWPGRRIPTARSPESPRRPDQANVYAPASLKEAAPRHPAPLHLSPRHEISSTPCGSSRRQQAGGRCGHISENNAPTPTSACRSRNRGI